jgi:O-antigen/teichoic acid export membrane protein
VLARKSFLIFAANLVGALFGVVSLFFIGRYMTPAAFGMVGFALGLLGMAAFLANLGFTKAHIKRVAEGKDVGACNGTFLSIKSVLVALFVVVSVSLILVREFTVGWVAATALPVLLVMVVYYALLEMRRVPEGTLDALRLTASTQTMSLIENFVRTPLIVVTALLFGFLRERSVPLSALPEAIASFLGLTEPLTEMGGAVLIALAYTVAMSVSLVSGFWLMRRHNLRFKAFDRELAKSYVRFGLPVGAYKALRTMMYHLDNVMIGYFWTATEVGFYFAAQRLVTVVLIIPNAIKTLFFPMISELIAAKEWDAVKEVAVTTQRLMSLVLFPVLMLTLLYAPDMIRIFVSGSFMPAAPALQFLVTSVTLAAFTTVASSMLLGMDRPGLVATISIIGVSVNFTLNLILIPESILGVPLFGLRATGAAMATAGAKFVVLVLLVVVSYRLVGFSHVSKGTWKHIFAAGVTAAILWAAPRVHPFFEVVRVWDLLIAMFVGLVLYAAILWLLREVTKKDVLFFIDMMHPVHMGRYVRDELKTKKQQK